MPNLRPIPSADEDNLLEELARAVHGIDAPFACSGSLVPEDPVTLRFGDKTQVAFRRQPEYGTIDEAIRVLAAHCEPAPFGKGKRTLRDRRIRDALQLKAEGGAFTVLNFDPADDGVLGEVQKQLCPGDPNPLSAELYAVNVYGRDGHFVPHKDTPRGDDMLGTLVVCLPSRFSLGHFIVTHRGAHQVFDWARAISKQEEPTRIHWAAFFGDVDHSISKIWSGHRVALSYVLRRGHGAPEKPRSTSSSVSRLQAKLEELLAHPRFMPRGGVLGFPCTHMYSHVAGFQRKLGPLTAKSLHQLKGGDHDVAAAAMAAGLSVTLKPYLVENCADETWQLERFPTKNDRLSMGEQITGYDVEELLPVSGHGFADELGVTWVVPQPEFNGEIEPKVVEGDEESEVPVVERFHSCEYSATGYFGNEGGEVDFYVYAALHVEVPSKGKRRKPRAGS